MESCPHRVVVLMLISSPHSITALKNTPLSVNARQDPHLLNAAVLDQLIRQVHAENQLQKSISKLSSSDTTMTANAKQTVSTLRHLSHHATGVCPL
jgi:hypothetical protein